VRDLEHVALLQDPARRALYEYVVAQQRDVGRNEAAEAVGLQRTLTAFHLDRLAAAGLLEVSYRRLSGRSGPGAGRPAKLYRRATSEWSVSVPPRDYGGAAHVLADAIERSGTEAALFAAAHEAGVSAGRELEVGEARPKTQTPTAETDRPDPEPLAVAFERLIQHLDQRGYQPSRDGHSVRLLNCPFGTLAQRYPVVACGMNLAMLQGVLEGAGLEVGCEARMDARPGACCVTVISKTNKN